MAELQVKTSTPATSSTTAVELKVEILESSFVKPCEETPINTTFSLSNLDFKLRYYGQTLYYFRQPRQTADDEHSSGFFSPEILKSALGRTLVFFYPLAGKLVVGDHQGQKEEMISCTGDGALFVVAKSENVLDDLGYVIPSLEIKEMLVPSTESGKPPCSLVMFQVTFFKCGSVSFGTAIHHIIADGYSGLHFIKTWSDIARGRGVVDVVPPVLDRSLLRARSPPAVRYDHFEYDDVDRMNRLGSAKSASDKPGKTAFLLLTRDNINALKNTIKHTSPLDEVSTFQALAAHVWRCACKARRLTGDSDTRLYMSVDIRGKVNPPLPPGYLGNAFIIASATASVSEIISNPIGLAASRIRETLAKVCNDDYVRSLIDYLELQKMDSSLPLEAVMALPETVVSVNSWMRLPTVDADFGWGKPEFMMPASLPSKGKAYFLKIPKDDDGGVMVVACFEEENMALFMEALYDGLTITL